ncbi:MAG: hypothetical protein QMB98_06935 [Flaviflexus sp.]|uniref:hypothetical protein n=1 Tax=Flaviflexus sp. TaxID=1969482 RepID=UPI00352E052B
MPLTDSTSAREALRAALKDAMKGRGRDAGTALRSALAAIDNAEAVDASPTKLETTSEHVAGASIGAGSAEAMRRELSEVEIRAILEREMSERIEVAQEFESLGQLGEAARLRREAEALAPFIG